jgi:hypothetical protein
MAIVARQRGAQDYQVKSVTAQGFLNALTVESNGHVVPGFLHFGCLSGKRGFVGLAIQNLDRGLRSGLVSGLLSSGHGPSSNSLEA